MPRLSCAALAAIMLVASAASGSAQQRQITGHVTDQSTSAPVADAQITVQSTRLGTTSDSRGEFRLQVPTGAVTLGVRRIGYRPTTVGVAADQDTVSIALVPEALQLETQVVTGQATTVARLNAANDVAVIGPQQLVRTQTATVENALQGKVAGSSSRRTPVHRAGGSRSAFAEPPRSSGTPNRSTWSTACPSTTPPSSPV